MSTGAHAKYTSKGTHYWCEDCAVAHTGAGAHVGDAPDSILGTRGVASTMGYAWCATERAYHYTSRKRAEGNIGITVGRLQDLWTRADAQPTRPVRVVFPATERARVAVIRATEYADAYDAQRVAPSRAPMTRGGGSVALRTLAPVPLTGGARRALARVNQWGTADGRAECARDTDALRARIDARENA